MGFRRVPAGVQDMLPRECQILTRVKEQLGRTFHAAGFEPVMPAALEYYDTYAAIPNAVPQEKLFKATDTDGKLLVLRPDVTLALSRIAATKLSDLPARLYYFAEKWDMQPAGGDVFGREVYQAGVECLGERGAFSDAQAIAFSIECLKAVGLHDFLLDLGHMEYFKGILEECGLSEREEEQVRACINAKDGMTAERILRRAGAKADAVNTVLALPALFGGAEVFERARSLTKNARALAALDHLEAVFELLCKMGYEDEIRFDLGTVRRLSYYTGIVFSALVKGLGAPVLSGGRYDGLALDFGKDVPAVGFAMGLKRVLVALERQGALPCPEMLDVVIACEEGAESEGYAAAQKMRAQGKRVCLLSEHTVTEEARRGAKEAFLATREGLKKI